MQHGFVVVHDCFTAEAAAEWTRDVWTRLGMSPTDKTTWTRERTNMPEHRRLSVPEFAPRAWDAICDLVGGEDRVTDTSRGWNDSFIVNLGTAEGEGKEYAPKELEGWHVDGEFCLALSSFVLGRGEKERGGMRRRRRRRRKEKDSQQK